MQKILRALGRVVSFPFRAIWWLVKLPFRGVKKAAAFMTFEPEDRSIADAFAATMEQPAGLLEHIDALRKHLFRMLIALIIGVGVCATFTEKIIDFLAKPIGGISQLQAIDVTESVGVFMQVALFGGLAVTLPYIAFELWLFAAPGLSARARRSGLLGIPLTLVFFFGGLYFSYRYLLPTALPFLLQFMGIHTIPRISSYINFVTNLLFWIGISFEFPLVIYVITLMGLIQPKLLVKQWRIAIVIIAIIAAAVTPTVDPVNMSLVMLPMILLYFLSILLSNIAYAGRRREAQGREAKP